MSVRGVPGDYYADVVLGQQDFTQINPYHLIDDVTFYNPCGVFIDTTVTPNLLYVFDSGHNRICVYRWTPGVTTSFPPAHLIIGQPQGASYGGANLDSAFSNFPTVPVISASTINSAPFNALSPAEGGIGSQMDIDSQGNLWLVDAFNSRVLRFPRGSGVADKVIGQLNFTSGSINRGLGAGACDNNSLYFSWNASDNENTYQAGLQIDDSDNVWVSDTGNQRILRFNQSDDYAFASLVLGQPNFTTNGSGTSLSKMSGSTSIAFSSDYTILYVADKTNNRVMAFEEPWSNGMAGANILTITFPTVLLIDPTESNRIWIGNTSDQIFLYELSGMTVVPGRTLSNGSGNFLGTDIGNLGVTPDGGIFATAQRGEKSGQVFYWAHGASGTTATLLADLTTAHIVTQEGFAVINGVCATDSQLIVLDNGRVLFWNDLTSLYTGKPCDGYLSGFAPDNLDFPAGFNDRDTSGASGGGGTLSDRTAMAVDSDNEHLWITVKTANKQGAGTWSAGVICYTLPLQTGQTPSVRLGQNTTTPTPILTLEGASITPYDVNWGVEPNHDSTELWITSQYSNRAIRIKNPLTAPVVDCVLGQADATSILANRGGAAADNTLALPGACALDNNGNLFISDHSLETKGNRRLMMYSAAGIPSGGASTLYGIAATKVFTSFATWQPAFSPSNKMVIGYSPYWTANPTPVTVNGYVGYNPGLYNNPTQAGSFNPDAFLSDFYSMAIGADFDDNGNLYMSDHNRNLIRIYYNLFDDGKRWTQLNIGSRPYVPVGNGVFINFVVADHPNNLGTRGIPTGTITLTGAASVGGANLLGIIQKTLINGEASVFLTYTDFDVIPLNQTFGNIPVYYFTAAYSGDSNYEAKSESFTILNRDYGQNVP